MTNFIEQLEQQSPLVKTLIVLGTLLAMIIIVGTIVTTVIRPKNKSYIELQKEVVKQDEKAQKIAKDHKPGRWG